MKKMFLMIFLIATLSCIKKNCEVPKQIIGTGEIVSTAKVSHPLTTWVMRDKEHIIQSDSQNVYNLQVSFDDGKTYDSIDFNKYTLLGKYASEGCEVTFQRNVTKNDSEKKYYYKIIVHQCGLCLTNWESMNWVLVPKIPDDYSVEFEVEYKSYNRSRRWYNQQ
jgi:hypothetical protein